MRLFLTALLSLCLATTSAHAAGAPTFLDAAGARHTVEEWKGKRLIVNLWATWCGPCVHELPALDRLQRDLAAKGVEVVAISVDRKDPQAIQQFLLDKNITHLKFYHDPTSAMLATYGTGGLPTTLVFGENGERLARLSGVPDWDSQDVRDWIFSNMKTLPKGAR